MIEQDLPGFRFGDERALRALYDEYASLVHTFCARIVGPDRAADVTPEVFISAWRSRESFDPSADTFARRLLTIATRRGIDASERFGQQPAFDLKTIEQIADRMLLHDIVSQLPARARRTVELTVFDQLTTAEIAASTGSPLDTVVEDLNRAVSTIRDRLRAFQNG